MEKNINIIKLILRFEKSQLEFFLNGPSPASFSFIFGRFQTNINTILKQINVKNVHTVYGAGIWTHNLQNTSIFP